MFVSFASSYWAFWTSSAGKSSFSTRWARSGKTRCLSQWGMTVLVRSYSAIFVDAGGGGAERRGPVLRTLRAMKSSKLWLPDWASVHARGRRARGHDTRPARRWIALLRLSLAVACAMTAITRSLPWFVNDLGVSIVGQVRARPLPAATPATDLAIPALLFVSRREPRLWRCGLSQVLPFQGSGRRHRHWRVDYEGPPAAPQ